MRLPQARPASLFILLSLAALAPGWTARAQIAPPPQTYVAALANAPFRAPATGEFAPAANFTMEAWIYLTANTPYAWLMGKGLATSGTDPFISFALQLNGDGTRLLFTTSTGTAGSYREVVAPGPLPLRTWTHVAAVMDGATKRLIINGQVVATGASSGAAPALPAVPFGVGIAYLPDGRTNYPTFPGFARQVRFWSAARTEAQIAAAAAESLPADRTGLVAAWPLDESSGNTARDISGNNRSLSGGGAWQRVAVLETGPFFSTATTAISDGSLRHISDGHIIDFDSDGDQDLILVQVSSPPTVPETRTRLRAFRNNGGTFVDVTDAVLGTVTMVHPRHAFVTDFNADGRSDIVIIGHGTDTPPFPGEQTKLLVQTADGRLVDESATRLPQRSSFTHNVAGADIDGDGDTDLYLANVNGGDSGPRFLLNNGAGMFTEATERLPADISNRTGGRVYTSALLVDVNADGRADLVLGGENAASNELLLNNGAGTFARSAGLPPKFGGPDWSTVSIASADFNADGAPDLLLGTTGGTETLADGRTITGYGIPGLQLLLNRGGGTFHDATPAAGLAFSANERWVVWTRIQDFDNDGRPDILGMVASMDYSGNIPRLWLNRGAGSFVDASESFSIPNSAVHLAGDFDRDGRVDILNATANAVSVSRAVKQLPRGVFQATADNPGRLMNLSVRTQAGTGDETLITGFALSGAGTKPLLVRAIGPTLGAFGLTGTLADPMVEIAPLGQANIATNNNWAGTAALKTTFRAVGAFALSDDASTDAALVFSPGAGAYTAKIMGANNATGMALVEVYDAGSGNTVRLTNVSARTRVGTGDDALIAGFVVNGNVPKKLLIRAIGPTLGVFGVDGTLGDPILDVRPLGSENIVATNDNWRGTPALKAAFGSVGAFALADDNSRDAAIVIELPPGAYTATITGNNNNTGVALVEVYELP